MPVCRNISSTGVFALNKKYLPREAKWSLSLSLFYLSPRIIEKRSKLWRQYNIACTSSVLIVEITTWPSYPRIWRMSEKQIVDKRKRRVEGELGPSNCGYVAVVDFPRGGRVGIRRRMKRGRGRGRGSRIDRRRWGPTSRLLWLDLIVLALGREKNGIHSLSFYPPTHVTLATLGVEQGTKYEGTRWDETHLTTLARFALGVDAALWI